MLLERNEKMTIHGDGRIMRGSPYAADAADALDVIFHKGAQGEVYNITSADQLQVLEVDGKIFQFRSGEFCAQDFADAIKMVKDRAFNDSMYWTDGAKLDALG